MFRAQEIIADEQQNGSIKVAQLFSQSGLVRIFFAEIVTNTI